MRLQWTNHGDWDGLHFGDSQIGVVAHPCRAGGFLATWEGRPYCAPPVYEGKSRAAAKRAVRDHVLREMEREVMRAKKARKR